jgi:hypothetical protein
MPDESFEPNPGRSVEILHVGIEELPVVVIDNVLKDPQALVEFAATRVKFEQARQGYYPGMRAPLPPAYIDSMCEVIRPLVTEVFGLDGELITPGPIRGFALATTPPDQLVVQQRCAHADTSSSRQLAVLHYFCQPKHGGTSFYRHRETGFESLGQTRAKILLSCLRRDWAESGEPEARYLQGDNRWFEQIVSIEAKFDRMIVYRGKQLHSADIDPDVSLGTDPRKDRLTATFFPIYA